MSRWTRMVLAASVGASMAAWAAWPDRRPNLLLVTIDSLRADRVGCGAPAGGRAPNIEWLASRGACFANAFTDAPWTTAAMASVMTGRYGVRHGVRTPYQRLDDAENTLAEQLQAAGYQTAAVVGSFALDRILNLSQGFESYDDRYDMPLRLGPAARPRLPRAWAGDVDVDRGFRMRKLLADSARSDGAVADAAIGWLRRRATARPFFLWVHFLGPHRQQREDESMEEAIGRALRDYDMNVAAVDEQVGRVFEVLAREGVMDRTLTVLHGDHGQSLLEHGEIGHGSSLFDAVLHVPLVVSLPGRVAPQARVTAMARTIDVMPTILDLLGLSRPGVVEGRSLAAALAGASMDDGVGLYCETLISASVFVAAVGSPAGGADMPLGFRRRCLRTREWKYVLTEPYPLIDFTRPPPLPADAGRQGAETLYDLRIDPGEAVDVAPQRPAVVRSLRQRLVEIAATPSRGS